MFVKIWEHVEMVTWCLKGLIPPESEKCLYMSMPYSHLLCGIVHEALDTAVPAAGGSGQPQKAVTLPREATDVMKI